MHTIVSRISLPQIAWLALALIWGSTWLAVRIGLETLPPLTFAGLRFLIASVVLLTVMAIRGTRLPRGSAEWRLIVSTAVFGFAVSYAAQFWGMQFVPSGLAAVMFSTVPLFTMLFAHAALPSEPITVRKLVGVVVGILGVAFIFADQLASTNPRAVLGVVAFLVGAVALAGSQVAVKAKGAGLDPLVLAGLQMAVTGIVLFGLGATLEGHPGRLQWTLSAFTSLMYLALVGSAFAFSLFYWLLKHMTVTKTLSVMLTHPPIAILLGWLVLGESLSWRVLAGAATVASGLWMILRSEAKPHRTRARAFARWRGGIRKVPAVCTTPSGLPDAVAEESR